MFFMAALTLYMGHWQKDFKGFLLTETQIVGNCSMQIVSLR